MSSEWYKDAVIYQVHVRSFFDSNDDGYGDFEGLRQKLSYVQELGVNTLWLLPFYESPLRDDGYDIADYYKILPIHGDLSDFKRFLDEAHERGLRVITELVLNHTSDQHPWFQEARRPGSAKRDWYVWSDTTERYQDVRIIFTDTEHSNWTWDPVAKAYFWHRFFSHQPDLNWDNPEVERAMHEVMFYWLDMGVDGLRLDAVPYLYEREGTSGENLPETLDAIKRLRKVLDERYGGEKILLAEANQWPEDTLPYFGNGDGVQMAFNFPVMPRMYMAVRRENRQPIVEMLNLTADIPPAAQWALFLRNHDELTLEMVTDEERDFMYHEYASDRQFRLNLGIRRRLAPLLGGERRRIELMNALIMSLKGSPIIYYGDELGMGDNVFLGDRNGVRTPMQWSPDRNAGFSKAPFHQLFLPPINEGRYSYHFVNVEEAKGSPHSLYHFMRRLLAVRNQHGKTFGRGSFDVLEVDNMRVLAFLRRYEDEIVLVVANLSRFAQAASLPLGEYRGLAPLELFSRSHFPLIVDDEYPLTLGPHSFYWFRLEPLPEAPSEFDVDEAEVEPRRHLPTLALAGGLETLLVDTMLQGDARKRLEQLLPDFLEMQRWFGGHKKEIVSARLEDAVRLQASPTAIYLALVRVEFEAGRVERYFLPLAAAGPDEAEAIREARPQAALAWVRCDGSHMVLHDATANPAFWLALHQQMQRQWRGRSLKGLYTAATWPGATLAEAQGVRVLGVEQSNSSAILEGAGFVKLYRKLADGPNPEVEMLGYLTKTGFPFVPKVQGTLQFKRGTHELTLGLVQEVLESEGDAWSYALAELTRFYERVVETPLPQDGAPRAFDDPIPAWLEGLAGELVQLAQHLGVRTAELHRALARADEEALAPEPTRRDDLASLVARVRDEADRTLVLAKEHKLKLRVTPLRRALKALSRLEKLDPDWNKLRIHGDYHLGQILQSEGEYYILDFEGEPLRSLAERRSKDQALRDVAGMLRSLEYAGLAAYRQHPHREQNGALETWAELITAWQRAIFLEAYFSTAGTEATFIPHDPGVRDNLLWAFLLDKVLYEIRYELGHRAEWVSLPLAGLRRLLTEMEGA
jgi:maltose alpha-D-glucosyltransferase/alpha-amylase